jgi:hypothetical protein
MFRRKFNRILPVSHVRFPSELISEHLFRCLKYRFHRRNIVNDFSCCWLKYFKTITGLTVRGLLLNILIHPVMIGAVSSSGD